MGQQKPQIQQKERTHQNSSAQKAADAEKPHERMRQYHPRFSFTGSAPPPNIPPNPQNILNLQQTIGNQAVGRFIQAKLKIGQPGDKYEQEANRVADAVMGRPEPQLHPQPAEEEEEELIQSKPLSEQITPLFQRHVEEGEAIQTKLMFPSRLTIQKQEEPEEDEETIQTKRHKSKSPEITSNLVSRIQSLRGSGHPLPKSIGAYFEPRFGVDFGKVRVHTDIQAADTAQKLKASAFTSGQNMVFGAGQYAPETKVGEKLLAHELTHVVQQAGDKAQKKLIIGEASNKNNQEVGRIQSLKSYYEGSERHELIMTQREKRSSNKDKKSETEDIRRDIKEKSRNFDPDKMQGLGTGHTASVYFYTKESQLEQEGHLILFEVAQRYVATVDWKEAAKRTERASLRGRVTGHADIRPSSNPDNNALSRNRARLVAQILVCYVNELIRGIGEITPELIIEGAGIKDCQLNCENYKDPSELSKYRRADVYIDPPDFSKKEPKTEEKKPTIEEPYKEQIEDAVRELREAGFNQSMIEALLSELGPLEIVDNLLSLINLFTEFLPFVTDLIGLAGQLLALAGAWSVALVGKRYVLAPISYKAVAYGATAWFFNKPHPLELPNSDIEELKAMGRENWIKDAKEIWINSSSDGAMAFAKLYARWNERYYNETKKELKIKSIKKLMCSMFDYNPKKMACSFYKSMVEGAWGLTPSRRAEYKLRIKCDFPN